MKNNKKFLLALGACALMMNPEVASAATGATDIKGMAEATEANIVAIKSLAMSLFYLAGLVLFGGGLFLIYKDQKTPNQGHAKNGFISIAIGVCLLLIPSLVNIFSTSIGGSSEAAGKALSTAKGF